MNDQRSRLQGMFQPNSRFQNFGDAISKIQVQGFRCHQNTIIEIENPITAFCGPNGTGKSTLLQLAATAYKNASGLGRHYIKNFIIAGKLDQQPFSPNATVKYDYIQPLGAGGGPQIKTLTVSRGTSKWSGYHRQPTRRVYFAGVGLYLPRVEEWDSATRNANTLEIGEIVPIESSIKQSISTILGSAYDTANETNVGINAKFHKIVTVGRYSATYSEINMGCGEGRIFHLVRVLESLPDKSLILLEEPETSLHPSAQHLFGKYLVDVAIRKRHQIFLTTHSEYLLLALPEKSRILLIQTPSGVHKIPGIGVRQAMSLMSDQHVPSLHILVEDDVALVVLSEVLRRHDTFFQRTVRIVEAGDKDQIASFMKIFNEQALPVCAVRDGDVGEDQKKKLFSLFGTEPPEKEIFKSKSFETYMVSKYQINWADLMVKIKSIDHHEWFDELARVTLLKRDALLQMAAEAYLDSVPENDRLALISKLKGAVK